MNTNDSRSSEKTAKPIKYQPANDTDRLAFEIARGLGEEKKLPIYRMVCENRSEKVVRRAFEQATNTPKEKIKKSRSALFFYLLNKYNDEERD
jgi:DNA replication initiation complex subunit (GINS family)